MQLSRKLAYENLQKANKFLQKTEKRKEAEVLKWREKQAKQKPRKVSIEEQSKSHQHMTCLSKKEKLSSYCKNQNKNKSSIWTIDKCLKTSNDDDDDYLKEKLLEIDNQMRDQMDDSIDEGKIDSIQVRSILMKESFNH